MLRVEILRAAMSYKSGRGARMVCGRSSLDRDCLCNWLPCMVIFAKNADTHKGDHHPLVFWINVQPNEGHQIAKSMQQNSPLFHESDELDWVSGARIVWMRRGAEWKKTCRVHWEKHTCVSQSHCFKFSKSLLEPVIYLDLLSVCRAGFQGL